MMIHDKFMSGQFLLDLKNERSSLLNAGAITQQDPLQRLQPPTPPDLDIYSAYAYQHQLQRQQQKLLNNARILPANYIQQASHAEVLDLSRRDSVETPHKTPSPYCTNSSLGYDTPANSPICLITQQHQQPQLLPANPLYAAQVQNVNNLNIPVNLAALYPTLYYPSAVKQEVISNSPPLSATVSKPVNDIANNNMLQTFASAAAAATSSLKHDLNPEHHSPQQAIESAANTTPSTSSSSVLSLDPKNTRPFKAYPRDPLVIAATFAAADVLIDNPGVERYTEYRNRVLEQIRTSNGGSRTVSNPKMRRTNSSTRIHEGSSSTNSENDERHHEESSDCDSYSGHDNKTASRKNCRSSENNNTNTTSGSSSIVKDAAYYERRRKNNAAAKKSRDRRRIKEDEIAIRAAFLERQNIELLREIDVLKAQLAVLSSKIP